MSFNTLPKLISNWVIWDSFKKGKELPEYEYYSRRELARANQVGCD